jgi:hypothetical protein
MDITTALFWLVNDQICILLIEYPLLEGRQDVEQLFVQIPGADTYSGIAWRLRN